MQFQTVWKRKKKEVFRVTSSEARSLITMDTVLSLDTLGHQDFSEDTYRTLMAADSAVMVIGCIEGCGGSDAKTV